MNWLRSKGFGQLISVVRGAPVDRVKMQMGSSSDGGHGPAMAFYSAILEEKRVYRLERYDIVVRSLWITALFFAGVYLLDPEEVSRTVFYLVFLGVIPLVMLAGMLTWADTLLAMSVAEVNTYFLQLDFPELRWPEQVEQTRQRQMFHVGRNRYGFYGGLIVFLGMPFGSVFQALIRGSSFTSQGVVVDSSLISLASCLLVAQVFVTRSITRQLLYVGATKTRLAKEMSKSLRNE